MNITPINNYYNYKIQPLIYQQNPRCYSPAFEGAKLNAAIEKSEHKLEYVIRLLGNRLFDLFEGKNSKQITQLLSQIKPEQNEKYRIMLEYISRLYSPNKRIDVNIENKILERIAHNKNSVIFIMNHSNQSSDPSMLAGLNSLLITSYKEAGRGKDYPLPKIILNKDILTAMNKTKRKVFESLGAVGIDANIYNADKKHNARVFLPVIKDFIRNKCNIFIFPEGKLAIMKNMDLENRFQSGIAELINKVLGIKKEVTVVPVGFSYGKGANKQLNGMHIGEPVTFKRDKDVTTVTQGSVLKSNFADTGFRDFFSRHRDEQDVVITEKGTPVKPKEVTGFIKSLLSENLNICTHEAQEKIKAPTGGDNTFSV